MNEQQRFADGSVFGRRYDYADGTVFAADFGAGEATVDVVDGTVIVVTDDEQYEFEVPGVARATINNGVLTVEVTGGADTDDEDGGVDVEVDA
jgi:hypothetical protein